MVGEKISDVECDFLILVPTRAERDWLREVWPEDSFVHQGQLIRVAECGFGVIAAAALAARWITRWRPKRVILMGIAGSYQDQLPLGTAYAFHQVGCYGIGVGSGQQFIPAKKLGWPQWQGDDLSEAIGDQIDLTFPEFNWQPRTGDNPRLLLTVTSAAAHGDDVSQRLAAFPHAAAEEMEGFAVAVACCLEKIPLTIVRGISNRAGNRDKSGWKIKESLFAAAEVCQQIIEQANL